jgi:hypothetical protein
MEVGSEPVHVEEGSDSGEFQGQRHRSSKLLPSTTPKPREEMKTMPQISPSESGPDARLGFLLDVRRAARVGLPPVVETGSCRKRGRTPVALSSDGDRPVHKKGRKKAKSPWFVLHLAVY